jgi:hypothetical protein
MAFGQQALLVTFPEHAVTNRKRPDADRAGALLFAVGGLR